MNRLIVAFILTFQLCVFVPVQTVAASDVGDILIGTVIEFTITKEYYKYMDNNMQEQYFQQYARKYGMTNNQELNKQLFRIVNRIQQAPGNDEARKRPVQAFVNAQQSMNAFRGVGNVISLNEGLWTHLTSEDEIAFITAHEIAHGSKQHLIRNLDKIIGWTLARQIFLAKNNPTLLNQILSWSAVNYILAKSATLPLEWEADNAAFTYATNAGYNPGAGAAAKAKMRAIYGDRTPNFFGEFLSPQDHPTFSQRIDNFMGKVTAYSGGAITTEKTLLGVAVKAKGETIFVPVKAYGQLQDERAYLIAGNLARLCHNEGNFATPFRVENGSVYNSFYKIVTPADGEPDAAEAAEKLNQVFNLQL